MTSSMIISSELPKRLVSRHFQGLRAGCPEVDHVRSVPNSCPILTKSVAKTLGPLPASRACSPSVFASDQRINGRSGRHRGGLRTAVVTATVLPVDDDALVHAGLGMIPSSAEDLETSARCCPHGHPHGRNGRHHLDSRLCAVSTLPQVIVLITPGRSAGDECAPGEQDHGMAMTTFADMLDFQVTDCLGRSSRAKVMSTVG